MKKALSCMLLLFIALSVFADTPPGLIGKEHFAFVHIKSGLRVDYDSRIDAIAVVLGPPSITFDEPIPNRPSYKKYSWHGLELSVLPDSDIIIYMTVTNADFRTRDGLSIGDSTRRLPVKYGPPAFQRPQYVEFQYSDMSETWGLAFISDECGIIREIKIGRGD